MTYIDLQNLHTSFVLFLSSFDNNFILIARVINSAGRAEELVAFLQIEIDS